VRKCLWETSFLIYKLPGVLYHSRHLEQGRRTPGFRHLPQIKRRLCSHEAGSFPSIVMRQPHVFKSQFWNGCARLVCYNDPWHVAVNDNQSLGVLQGMAYGFILSPALVGVKPPKPFAGLKAPFQMRNKHPSLYDMGCGMHMVSSHAYKRSGLDATRTFTCNDALRVFPVLANHVSTDFSHLPPTAMGLCHCEPSWRERSNQSICHECWTTPLVAG
jgi:hypothetical protein